LGVDNITADVALYFCHILLLNYVTGYNNSTKGYISGTLVP